MFVVAIAERNGDADIEARELAPVLGVLAYDLRLAMSGILPRVVLRTPSQERAESAVSILRSRGHGAITCDLAEVVPTARMQPVRHFGLDAYALHADATSGPSLPFDAIGALVRIAVRARVDRSLSERVVPASGADGESTTLEHEGNRHVREVIEESLVIVPHDAKGFILRENEARYAALGERRGTTTRASFLATVALLRERAVNAAYDERFAEHPLDASTALRMVTGERVPAVRAGEHDLRIHLLARWLMRARGGPYRG